MHKHKCTIVVQVHRGGLANSILCGRSGKANGVTGMGGEGGGGEEEGEEENKDEICLLEPGARGYLI